MKQLFSLFFKSLLVLVIFISPGKADWLNYTGAESAPNIARIDIHDKKIVLKLEISFNDIKVFKELVPVEWTKGIQRPSMQARMDYFSNNGIQIIADGKVLAAQLTVAEGRSRTELKSKNAGKLNPYTNKIIKGTADDKNILYAEITYTLDNKPPNIEIVPPTYNHGGLKATIGFVTYHNSVPINDYRFLSKPSTLEVDWLDPWFTKFKNKNLSRHHKYPLMLYLYVEPRVVRFESLMRIDDISKLTQYDALETKTKKLPQLKTHLQTYFENDKKLHIDERVALADVVKINYFTVGLTGLELLDNIDENDTSALLVGVSQQYYIESLPNHIRSEWLYFNNKIDSIPLVATDPAGPFPSFIYQDSSTVTWTNYIQDKTEPVLNPVKVKTGMYLDIPLIGNTKIITEAPNEQQSKQIIEQVFENVRIAFIEKRAKRLSAELSKILSSSNNDLVSSALAKLFAPPMVRGGIGAIEAFDDIKIDNIIELEGSQGFNTSVSGNATLFAQHWGHSDRLKQRFQLSVDILEKEGQWFITDFTLLDLKASK